MMKRSDSAVRKRWDGGGKGMLPGNRLSGGRAPSPSIVERGYGEVKGWPGGRVDECVAEQWKAAVVERVDGDYATTTMDARSLAGEF